MTDQPRHPHRTGAALAALASLALGSCWWAMRESPETAASAVSAPPAIVAQAPPSHAPTPSETGFIAPGMEMPTAVGLPPPLEPEPRGLVDDVIPPSMREIPGLEPERPTTASLPASVAGTADVSTASSAGFDEKTAPRDDGSKPAGEPVPPTVAERDYEGKEIGPDFRPPTTLEVHRDLRQDNSVLHLPPSVVEVPPPPPDLSRRERGWVGRPGRGSDTRAF